MERMLVVVFDNEAKAYEGSRALNQLDAEGSVTVHAESVIGKNPDGTTKALQAHGDFPIRAVAGTAIGSLIGLLGGPIGFGLGAYTGALAGTLADLDLAGVDAEFVDDAARALTPGHCAVVAQISEEWVTPVDTRMEALGGTVFRAARQTVQREQEIREDAEIRAEIEQLRAEHAQARAERKAKLQAAIDRLQARLQSHIDQTKRLWEDTKRESEAKLAAVQQKAAKAQGEHKAALDARVNQIRAEHEQAQARLKNAAASGLRKAADRIEKRQAV